MPTLTLFRRLILRPLAKEPLRTLLTVVAIALGVAVVLAIEMAGAAAAGSFRSSIETLTGDADLEITAVGGIPPSVMTSVALLPHPYRVRARIEDYAVIAADGRTVPFIGIDVLSAVPENIDTASVRLPERDKDSAVWVGDGLGVKAGDRVRLLINDRESDYAVQGVLGTGSGDLILTDLGIADRVLSRKGALDRILIQVPRTGNFREWESILQRTIPAGVTLSPAGSKTQQNQRMLNAFRWNLRVLSYISLVVGAFLIYNAISVSVVRRRTEIGILRALGAARATILAAFLGEAFCLGLAGAAAGVALGRVLAAAAVQSVAITVESLYVSSRPAPITLDWQTALLGFVLGTGVAVLSAFAPSWEASRVAPVEAMARGRREHVARLHSGRNLLVAVSFAAAAAVASQQPAVGGKPLFGYAASMLMIGASAFAIPSIVTVLSRAAAGPLQRIGGAEGLLATRSIAASLRRTAVLVGALSTAIAMMSAVAIMVGSFRETVVVWMDDALQADLYLRPAGSAAADRHPTLSTDIPDRIERLPQVAAVDRFRAYEITYDGLPATLAGGTSRNYGHRTFVSGTDTPTVARDLIETDSVVVSEPFSNKHKLKKGDFVTLPLRNKQVRFRIADVYFDYSSERGYILMDRKTLLKFLPGPESSNIAVHLKDGVSLDEGRRAVESATAGRKVLIFSNRTLRTEAIRIFDRTFAITYALEGVAVIVAIMGVAGALIAMVIDRRREVGLLRFLGGATGQIRRIIFFEAGLLGLFANITGVILGSFLSMLLVWVINKQSFGWTIQFHWPIAVLVGALSTVYIATILACIVPANIAARLNPIEVVHEE